MKMSVFACVGALMLATSANAAPQIVLSADFDSAAVTGGGASATSFPNGGIESSSSAFTNNYFRNQGTALSSITLSNLADHDSIDFDFDLLFVDSWDGSVNSSVAPDFLFLTIDGVQVAQLSVNNFDNNEFSVPGGVQLAYGNFTATGGFADRIVSMDDAGYLSFAHTASSITFGIRAGGSGFQTGSDESWGVDNIVVTINTVPGAVPEPATWAMMIAGFGMIGGMMRRRSTMLVKA